MPWICLSATIPAGSALSDGIDVRAGRSPENLSSVIQKEFCNSIRGKADIPPTPLIRADEKIE